MTVAVRREQGILFASLDRPEVDNRLDAATIEELTAIFEGTDADQDPPAAIVLGSTSSDFSLGRQRAVGAPQTPSVLTAEFQGIQRLNEAVQRCKAVTVAAITGRAEGAGLSLAARCDIVVVAEDAQLCFPEVSHGIPPAIVLSHYRYVLPRAILGDLIFTGRVLDGQEAVRFGLAARCVPAARVEDEAREIASVVAGYDRRSIVLVKDFLAKTESVSRVDAPALGIALYSLEMVDRALAD